MENSATKITKPTKLKRPEQLYDMVEVWWDDAAGLRHGWMDRTEKIKAQMVIYRNLFLRGLSVLTGVGISDFVWTRYISSIGSGNAFESANWSVLVVGIGAFVVISYVEDRRLVVPALIGAWIGTYLGT